MKCRLILSLQYRALSANRAEFFERDHINLFILICLLTIVNMLQIIVFVLVVALGINCCLNAADFHIIFVGRYLISIRCHVCDCWRTHIGFEYNYKRFTEVIFFARLVAM